MKEIKKDWYSILVETGKPQEMRLKENWQEILLKIDTKACDENDVLQWIEERTDGVHEKFMIEEYDSGDSQDTDVSVIDDYLVLPSEIIESIDIPQKKLIRDNIPDMPEDAWEEVCPVEAYEHLKVKLNEEIQELVDSNYKDIYEYADVLEVLQTIARYNKIKWSNIKVAKSIKFKECGGFSNKILKGINEAKV